MGLPARSSTGRSEIEVWNAFMTKRGWREAGMQRLNERHAEIGLPPGTVQTMFEFIDLDEGRLKLGANQNHPAFARSTKTIIEGFPTAMYWPVNFKLPVLRFTRKAATLSARWLHT